MTQPEPDPNVVTFLGKGHPAYISVLTLRELKHGAALLKERKRSEKLLTWVMEKPKAKAFGYRALLESSNSPRLNR